MAIRASANKARATGAQADQGRQEQVLVTIVRILLALALAVPFVVMGGWLTETVYPYVVGKALFFRLVVEAAFAVWLYLLIRYPAYRLPRSWLLVSLLGYMVVALAASFAGVSLTHSLWSNYERMEGWITLGHLTMFALMLASVLRTFRHWQTVLNINLLAGLVVGLLGLFEVAGGEERRLSVTFGNPAFLASYAAVNLFIASAFLSHSLASPGGTGSPDTASASQALMRSFWVAVIGLDLLMLNYSGTRGAMVGLAVGIAMILVAGALWSERRILKMSCAAVLLALVALAAMVLLIRQGTISVNATQASPTLQRFIDLTPESFAVRSRLSSIDVGLEAFTARPVLGWGPENYGTAYDSHVDGEAAAGLFRFDRAHNRIVEELVVAGTIGLAAYAAVWSCLTWLFVTRIRALPLDRRLFTMFIGAGMAAYFVQNLFLFDTPAASVQLYLLLGFALYMASVSASAVFAPEPVPQITEKAVPTLLLRMENAVTTMAPVRYALVALIFAGSLFLCYVVVVGPYVGARNTSVALSKSRTGQERLAAYSAAVSASPSLSNETVRRFVDVLIDNWESLSGLERSMALEIAARDVDAGLRREPKEWRLHMALAQLYNWASEDNSELLRLAREHTDAAAAIAPGRVEVLQLRVQQLIFEGDDEAAIGLIDEYLRQAKPYLKEDSTTYRRLEELRHAYSIGN